MTNNGKNGRKRRRRIILGIIILLVLVGAGIGVTPPLRPNHQIDPAKLATVERGDIARSVVATGQGQPLAKVEIKSDRESTRLNSKHLVISYALFFFKK